MADLDAELLALAGGDSSDDEDTQPVVTTDKADTSTSPHHSATREASMAAGGKSSNARRPTKSRSVAEKATTRRGRRVDSEEEGEASSEPASPESLQSAPMSESEAERSAGPDVDDDGPIFPVDNKFHSEKDKAEIMAMSEVQRESILAERAQLLERKQQDLTLRRLLQGYQAKEGDKSKASGLKKRTAGAADLEDGHRKSSRQKTTLGGRKVGETSDAMEAYKRQREQKGLQAEQRKREGEERKERKKHGSLDDRYSDADADGESDVEYDSKHRTQRRSVSELHDALPADIVDVNHVMVGRNNFAQVCFYPGFEDAIKQCFARISIGPDPTTGQNVYRCAQIIGFSEGKPYAMESANGKSFTTNQYARIALGKAVKEWPFLACSNSKITESEFERYKRTLAAENITLPTKPFLISKIDDINRLVNHRFTDQEIQEKLRRSGVLQSKYAAFERSTMNIRRKEAEERGDKAEIEKIDAELAALEGPKLAFGTSLQKAPVKISITGSSQQERLAALNKANRKQSSQEVRKAQVAERKAEAARAAAIARGEAPTKTSLARVKIQPTIHHDSSKYLLPPRINEPPKDDLFEGSSRENSRANTPLSGIASPNRLGTPKRSGAPSLVRHNSQEKKGGLPIIRSRNLDDDLMAAVDTGIEIDI